jgi:hypothetical protein
VILRLKQCIQDGVEQRQEPRDRIDL